MRKLLFFCGIIIGLAFGYKANATPTVTFTALAGNASTYLQQGNTNQVVFGFQMVVTNGPYQPFVFNISTTSNGSSSISTNAMFSGYLASISSATPANAVGASTQYNSLQFNSGVLSVTSMPSFATGTYYFYLVLNISVNQNAAPNQVVFTLPSVSTIAQNTTGVSSVTNLATNTVYTTGRNYDWTGATNTVWGTAGNWKDNTGNTSSSAPGQYDCARIGYASTYTNAPTVSSNTSVGQVILGTVSQVTNAMIVSAGTLTVNNDITVTADLNTNDITMSISGAGNITAVNFNMGNSTIPKNNNKFFGLTLSVNSLMLSGDINLSAYDLNGLRDFDPQVYITAGTVTAANLNSTINSGGTSNAFIILSVSNATLNFTGATPLGNLQSAITNGFTLNGTGATIGYTGAGQTVYTNSAITGLSGGVSYTNLAIGGSGTKTPRSGTVTVTGTFSTVASSTPTVDFTVNNAVMNVGSTFTNVSGATVKQGTGAFAITGVLNNAGTFTGNNGTLTASSGTVLTGGTFTTGAGLFSTTNLSNTTGTFQQGSGNVSLTGAISQFSGTMNFSAGTVGIATSVAITGGTMNGGTGAFTIGNSLSVGPGTLNCGASPGTLSVTGPFANASTGTFSAGTGTTTFKNTYTNNGTFTYGAGTIIFDNGTTPQALADNSTNGTTFNNVTFSGTGAKTMAGTGQFYVGSTGLLTMGTNTILTTGGILTLKSDANGSAAVDKMASGAGISGSAHVQRFLTGGGVASNRGYRLLSSPVNQTSATISNTNTFNLAYLNQHTFNGVAYAGAFTGGVFSNDALAQAGGFSGKSVTPTIYLYKESIAATNIGSLSGKHVGVIKVTATDVATLNTSDATATISNLTIPIGNGFLMYFVGPSTRSSGSSSIVPQDATMTDNGFINQGTFTVKLWYTPTGGAGKLSYSALANPGYNMVGNPYPSTLNLSQLYSDNSASIDVIYMLSKREGGTGQDYVAYSTNGSSSPAANGFAVSGAGFIVHAKSTSATLTFNENQKATSTQITGSSLIMDAPQAQVLAVDGKLGPNSLSIAQQRKMALPAPTTNQPLTGLYMKIEKDANVFGYCGIYYRKDYSAKFEEGDALYLAGPSSITSISSLSSDKVKTAINHLPDYHSGSRVWLNVSATATGIYNLKLEGVRNIDTLYNIYLIDHLKKDSLDIRRYGTYAFNLVSTDTSTFGGNRFELVISRKPVPQYLLTNFAATKVTEGVNINWNTVNESNYTSFTLEKLNKTTGEYTSLYDKQSDGSAAYNYVDHAPNSGNNIYRLKQNDIDNKISYSQPITIFYDKNAAGSGLFSVFPNPTSEMINVSIPEPASAATYKFKLYDSTGNLVMQKTSSTSNWSENIGSLKTGAYIVEVLKSNGASLGKGKFIKN